MVQVVISSAVDSGLFATAFGGILIAYLFISFVPGGARGRAFNKDFLSQFSDEHMAATGTDVASGGYPDMGSGRYAEKLSYEDWYKFGLAQRVHYNFLEQVTIVLLFLGVSGIQYPFVAGVLGLVYLVGRIIVSIGYLQGPHKRWMGNILMEPAFFALFFCAFISLYVRYSELTEAK